MIRDIVRDKVEGGKLMYTIWLDMTDAVRDSDHDAIYDNKIGI